jgi:hypothetical protein
VENTLQRYVSVRRFDFSFCVGNENRQNVLSIEETHERCEIGQKKHGVNTTGISVVTITNSDALQYEIPGRIECMGNRPLKKNVTRNMDYVTTI